MARLRKYIRDGWASLDIGYHQRKKKNVSHLGIVLWLDYHIGSKNYKATYVQGHLSKFAFKNESDAAMCFMHWG